MRSVNENPAAGTSTTDRLRGPGHLAGKRFASSRASLAAASARYSRELLRPGLSRASNTSGTWQRPSPVSGNIKSFNSAAATRAFEEPSPESLAPDPNRGHAPHAGDHHAPGSLKTAQHFGSITSSSRVFDSMGRSQHIIGCEQSAKPATASKYRMLTWNERATRMRLFYRTSCHCQQLRNKVFVYVPVALDRKQFRVSGKGVSGLCFVSGTRSAIECCR